MVSRVIEATEIRVGIYILINGEPYQVKKCDISSTGKHGHSKVRYEAINVLTGKKKVAVVPGHERFEVPMITKHKAQVLSISNGYASIMDSETYESYDIAIPEELKDSIKGGINVEYWDIEGEKILRKII